MIPADPADLLDGLDGVSYWTDLGGVVRGGGARRWAAFARANGAAGLSLEAVVGRSLFEIVAGDEVRAVYRALHEAVVAQARPLITFTFRCDAPDTERTMRMTLGPVHGEGRVEGVLYHSQVIDERERPPLALLAYADAARQLMDDDAPVAALCSFCHAVRWDGPPLEWIAPQAWYARGGQGPVRLSHGVCPACQGRFEAVVGGP